MLNPTSRAGRGPRDVVDRTDRLGVGLDLVAQPGDQPLVRRRHAEAEPVGPARLAHGVLDRVRLELEQDVARVDPGRVEGGVVHDLRVASLQRLPDEADPPGHRSAGDMRRTGPAVAGNVTLGMISSTQSLELRRIRGHRVQDEVLDAGVDAGLERGDHLVRRAEQVDGLEVVLAALGAHHLEEGAVLLLARLDRVVGQDQVQEVLVRDDAFVGVTAVLAVVGLELHPVAGDVLRRAGRARDPAIGAQDARLDRFHEPGQVR